MLIWLQRRNLHILCFLSAQRWVQYILLACDFTRDQLINQYVIYRFCLHVLTTLLQNSETVTVTGQISLQCAQFALEFYFALRSFARLPTLVH